MKYGLSRFAFDPSDPYRRWGLMWRTVPSYADMAVTMDDGLGGIVPCPTRGPGDEFTGMGGDFAVRFRVPVGTAPGEYKVCVDEVGTGHVVTVGHPPAVPVVESPAWVAIRNAVTAGGVAYVDQPVQIPNSTVLVGPENGTGTIVVRGLGQLIRPNGRATFRYLRIVHEWDDWDGDTTWQAGIFGGPLTGDVVLDRCEVSDARIMGIMLAVDCRLVRSVFEYGQGSSLPGLVIGGESSGACRGTVADAAFMVHGAAAAHRHALVNHRVDGPVRVLGCNSNSGAVTDGILALNVRTMGQTPRRNGNEMFIFEGPLARDNVVAYCMTAGGWNSFVTMDVSAATGNWFHGSTIQNMPIGFALVASFLPAGEPTLTGNYFTGNQILNAHCPFLFGTRAAGNHLYGNAWSTTEWAATNEQAWPPNAVSYTPIFRRARVNQPKGCVGLDWQVDGWKYPTAPGKNPSDSPPVVRMRFSPQWLVDAQTTADQYSLPPDSL